MHMLIDNHAYLEITDKIMRDFENIKSKEKPVLNNANNKNNPSSDHH